MKIVTVLQLKHNKWKSTNTARWLE